MPFDIDPRSGMRLPLPNRDLGIGIDPDSEPGRTGRLRRNIGRIDLIDRLRMHEVQRHEPLALLQLGKLAVGIAVKRL